MTKSQFPSLAWFLLLGTPLRISAALAWRKEKNKRRTIDRHNKPVVDAVNRTFMLLGRCIVVTAEKPLRE